MYVIILSLLLSFIVNTSTLSIPFIQNVFLYPSTTTNLNISVRSNSACQECLCEMVNFKNNTNYLALNCFTNETCQFFQTFPISYKLEPSTGAQLYFLQNIFPNASKCCMPNITDLIIRLQNATPAMINLTFQPAAFGYDETKPNETAVIGMSPGSLYWFNPNNMTFIRNSSVNASLSIALQNNSMFTAYNNVPIVNVLNSQTNSLLSNINYTSLVQVRKFIFINNSQTMIVSTQNFYSLTVFDIHSPTNYTFQQQILFPLIAAHGLAKINDTFIYASSWTNGSIVSYKYENSTWTNKRFVNATSTASGSHIAVDDCERVWFVNTQFGLRIYDSSGVDIANWNMSLGSNTIYDILLLPNYVLLVSRPQNKQIFRYDPQISCG